MSRCVRAKRRDRGQDIRVPLGSTWVPRPASGEGGRGKEGVTGTFWLLPFSQTVSLQYSVWSGATLWGSELRTLSKASCRASTRCDTLWAGQSCPRGNTLGSAARGCGAGQRPRHHGAQSTSEAGDAPAACAPTTKTALRKEATPLCATGSPLLAHGRAPRRARGSSPRFPGAGRGWGAAVRGGRRGFRGPSGCTYLRFRG